MSDRILPRTPDEHRLWWEANTDVPYGYCQCGCGLRTPTATSNRYERGIIKDCPTRFVQNHNSRWHGIPYIEEDRGYETPCHIWQGGKNRDGYGHMRARGRYKAAGKQVMMAHRYYYELEHGPIPDGHEIHHLCHEPSCQRASHMVVLESASHSKLNRNHKLTDEQVGEIRELRRETDLTFAEIGDLFGISGGHACGIVKGKYRKA